MRKQLPLPKKEPPPPLISLGELNNHQLQSLRDKVGVAKNLKVNKFNIESERLQPKQPGQIINPDPQLLGPSSGGRPAMSYVDRIQRAKQLQKEKIKQENRMLKNQEKQERKFQKMMESLKRGVKPEEESSSEDEDEDTAENSLPTAGSRQQITQPFEMTPHKAVMDRYMFQETKNLQTLHKDVTNSTTIERGQIPRLQDSELHSVIKQNNSEPPADGTNTTTFSNAEHKKYNSQIFVSPPPPNKISNQNFDVSQSVQITFKHFDKNKDSIQHVASSPVQDTENVDEDDDGQSILDVLQRVEQVPKMPPIGSKMSHLKMTANTPSSVNNSIFQMSKRSPRGGGFYNIQKDEPQMASVTKEFKSTINKYMHLLHNQQSPSSRMSRMNQSVDISSSKLKLPQLGGYKDKTSMVNFCLSPQNDLNHVKPVQIQCELTRKQQALRKFDKNFMKSPKIRQEYIKKQYQSMQRSFMPQPKRITFLTQEEPSPTKTVGGKTPTNLEDRTSPTPKSAMEKSRYTPADEKIEQQKVFQQALEEVNEGRFDKVDLGPFEESKKIKLREADKAYRENAYNQYLRGLKQKQQGIPEAAKKLKETYHIPNDVDKVIEMTDFMIRHKEETIAGSKKARQEADSKNRYTHLNIPDESKLSINKTRTRKKYRARSQESQGSQLSTVKSAASSESSTGFAKLRNTQPKTTKVDKKPPLCVVEKIALRFMHDIYKRSDTYTVDPEEADRCKFIDIKKMYKMSDEDVKKALQDHNVVDCSWHGSGEEERVAKRNALYKRFTVFYTDLLSDKHSKVSQEKLGAALIDYVMDSRELGFKSLKEKILKNNQQDATYEDLKKLNPEIFIKQEKPPEQTIIDSLPHQKCVPYENDPVGHHCFSYVPNKELQMNKKIFDQLIKGMIEAELNEQEIEEQQTEAEQLKKVSKNEIINHNVYTRRSTKMANQLEKQLTMKSGLFNHMAQEKGRKIAKDLLKLNNALRDNFKQRLKDYAHFQKSVQSDVTARFSQKDLVKILTVQNPNEEKSRRSPSPSWHDTEPDDGSSSGQRDQSPKNSTLNSPVTLPPSPVKNKEEEEDPSQAIINEKSQKHELYQKEFRRRKFFMKQKQFNLNPNHDPKKYSSYSQFFLKLKKDMVRIDPHFAAIKNYTLNLSNKLINSHSCAALADFIIAQTKLLENKATILRDEDSEEDAEPQKREALAEIKELVDHQIIIKDLTIDDCGMVDDDISVLLAAIITQGKLQKLTLANGVIGTKTIIVLADLLKNRSSLKTGEQGFNYLSLNNIKMDMIHIEMICQALEEIAQIGHCLPNLKLSQLNLNSSVATNSLSEMFNCADAMLKLDLSNSVLQPKLVAQITAALAEKAYNMELRNMTELSLAGLKIGAHNKIVEQLQDIVIEEEEDDNELQANQIVEDLCTIISKSKLIHLDLSAMGLSYRVFPILEAIKQSQQLAAVHLSDNEFSRDQKDKVMAVMGIQTFGYHMLTDQSNIYEPEEQAIIQSRFHGHDKMEQIQHNFFKNTVSKKSKTAAEKKNEYQAKILNQQINAEMKEERHKLKQEIDNGQLRNNAYQDPIILTRKLGHPELIFNEAPYYQNKELCLDNSDAKWMYQRKGCYVCNKHNYFQVFFTRQSAHLDYQILNDPELKKILKQTFKLDLIETMKHGSPILLSSVNNWVMTRLIDVRLFSQLLKGQNEDFIENSIKKQQESIQKQLASSKDEYLSMAQNKLKRKDSSNMGGGFNVREQQKLEAEALKAYEDEIDYVQTREYIKQEVEACKQRALNIKKQVSQGHFYSISGIKAIKPRDQFRHVESPLGRRLTLNPQFHSAPNRDGVFSPQSSVKKSTRMNAKNQQQTIDISDDEDVDDLVDAVAEMEWRDVLRKCQKYRDEMVVINFPPFTGTKQENLDIFTFAGFVKPGRHVIIIFDPKTRDFYRRDILVEVRNNSINLTNMVQLVADEEAEKMENMIFQQQMVDEDDQVRQLYGHDMQNERFCASSIDVSHDTFLKIQEHMPHLYKVLKKAYDIYLTRDDFPTSSLSKFTDFLVKIRLLSDDSSEMESQPSKRKILQLNKRDFYRLIRFEPVVKEDNFKNFTQEELEADTKGVIKTIYRQEFIMWILKLAYKNMNLKKEKLQKPNKGQMPMLQIMTHQEDFIIWFEHNVCPSLNAYVRKLGKLNQFFRPKQLWTPGVDCVLQGNIVLLSQIYKHYISLDPYHKFSLQHSAMKMLEEAGIKLHRTHQEKKNSRISNLTAESATPLKKEENHNEKVKRLFAQSKQIVKIECELYYKTLEWLEFLEFIARVADEFYHVSYACDNLEELKEKWQFVKKSKEMSDQEKNVELEKMRVLIKQRGMCLERLEFKIFQLLKDYFDEFGQNIELKARQSVEVFQQMSTIPVKLKKDNVLAVQPAVDKEQVKAYELRRKAMGAQNLDFEKIKGFEDEAATHIQMDSIEEESQEDSMIDMPDIKEEDVSLLSSGAEKVSESSQN